MPHTRRRVALGAIALEEIDATLQALGLEEVAVPLAPDASPFVEWDWLHALEASGCACAETGWTPYHLVVCSPGTTKLVAAMPLYLKSHSMGDFVDDQQWADEARQGGANYYPKLVSAVPFTPCQGSRVLMSEALSSGVQAQVCTVPSSRAAPESPLCPLSA